MMIDAKDDFSKRIETLTQRVHRIRSAFEKADASGDKVNARYYRLHLNQAEEKLMIARTAQGIQALKLPQTNKGN